MSKLPSASTSAPSSSTSSVKTRKSVENLRNIDLIGTTTHQIVGAKLPSNRQVLQVFFHNIRFVNMTAKESARLTINSVVIFWQQARIPTRYESRCIDKLNKLYETWKTVQKKVQRSGAHKAMEETFVESLDDLFDIASANALEIIRIEEDKQFLIMQRQKGRPGCMIGVDMKLYGKDVRGRKRREKEDLQKKKHEEASRESGSRNACNLLAKF